MTEEDFRLIEKFIENDMPDEETTIFQQKLANVPEFGRELSLQKTTLAYIAANEQATRKVAVLEDFRAIKRTIPETVVYFTPQRIIAYAIAASLTLLLGVFSIFQLTESGYSETFRAYHTPYDGVVNTRDKGNEVARSITIYLERRYDEALKLLTEQRDIKGMSEGQRCLLIANCYLQLKQPEKSLEWLARIKTSESSLVLANQKWYQALTYLMTEDLHTSRQLLEELGKGKTVYRTKARQLLQEAIFQE